MRKNHCILILLFLTYGSLFSQKILTPEEAVKIALNNNYGIKVSANEQEINRINNTAGNAGMLPSAGITVSDNYSFLTNSQLEYNTGEKINRSNGTSNVLNAGLDIGWTVFDGGKMFVTRTKLREIEAAGQYRYQDQVFQTIYDVITAYYNVVRQKQQLRSYQEVINVSEERVRILEISLNAGLKPKTDYLQARIDLNVFREQAIVQKSVIIAARRALNEQLSRDPEVDFEVADTIIEDFTPDEAVMLKDLFSKNMGILGAEKEVKIAGLTIREQRSLFFPSLDLTAGYSFLQSNNNTSQLRLNQNYGPEIGGTLRIPIYQSGEVRRSVAIARLNESSARFELEARKIQTTRQLRDALTAFSTQKELLDIELENHSLAKENLYISMERLRLGQTTSLEVREAQQSYSESSTRLLNLQFNLKVAETRLKQIMAAL